MFAFLLSIPAMLFPDNRRWLQVHGWLVVVCALFTLVLGLDIWFHTLKTRAYLNVIWSQQPAQTQSLLQQSVRFYSIMDSFIGERWRIDD
jgi:hypothetical protein